MFVRDRFTWLAYLLLAYFAYLQAAPSPAMPFLRAELDLDYVLTGLHFSAFASGMVLAAFSADRLAHHWGRRRLLWGGSGGMACGALLLISSHQPFLTLGSVFVMGFAGSLLLIVIQAALSDAHGPKRATALTESNVLAIIAASLVPLTVGGAVTIGLDWRAAMLLPVLLLLLLALRYHGVTVPEAKETAPSPEKHDRRLPGLFWIYWVVIILGTSAEWSLIFWGPDYLQKATGLSTVAAATAMSVLLGAMVLGRIAGSLATRWLPANRILLVSTLVALAGFILLWTSISVSGSLAGMFIAGLGITNVFPLTLSGGIGVAVDQVDLASARLSLGAGTAILLAPLLLGWMAEQIGIRQAFALIAFFIGSAAIMILITNRASKKKALHSPR